MQVQEVRTALQDLVVQLHRTLRQALKADGHITLWSTHSRGAQPGSPRSAS